MPESCKKKVIFIVGPTATGKTALSVKLAKKINGEIISADSMQAYKGMDIVSQKPAKSEQKNVKHHLIDFLDPKKEYSAAVFSALAGKAIIDIIRRGKIPIVAGGSGLYVKALMDGIFSSKGKNAKLRKKLEDLARQKGSLFLHESLKKIDPLSAEKIHPNDRKRIIRALEIYEVEKKTKTSLKAKTKGIKDKYDIRIFGLTMERAALYGKINKRVDIMFRKGLVKELKRLLGRKLSVSAGKVLGIKEIKGYLDKLYTLKKAKELLKRNTRRFAKRQFTWFRPDRRIKWVDSGNVSDEKALCIILKVLNKRPPR